VKTRFLPGLLLGASATGITWAAGASPLWTAVLGAGTALVVWFGPPAVDWIADLIDDLT
jgi:hypothetical protein